MSSTFIFRMFYSAAAGFLGVFGVVYSLADLSAIWMSVPVSQEGAMFAALAAGIAGAIWSGSLCASDDDARSSAQGELELSRRELAISSMDLGISRRAEEDARAHIRRLQGKLRSINFLFQRIVQDSPDPICVKDADGRYLLASESAARTFGCLSGAMLGKSDRDMLPEETAAIFAANDRKAMESEDPLSCEERVVLNGQDRVFHSTRKAYRDRRGRVLGVVTISRDITTREMRDERQRAMLESEREARREAERNSRAKDDFLSMLSHDLRSPLNAILGWCHILRRHHDVDSLHRAVDTIERNVRSQSRILSDLHEMNSIVAGSVVLEIRPQNVWAAAKAAASAAAQELSERGVRFALDEPAAIDQQAMIVNFDEARLEQVLQAVLTSAMKLSEQGSALRMGAAIAGGKIVIEIASESITISEDALPFLFDRLRYGPATLKRRLGGQGLGLSIAKRLIELHDGDIYARKAPDGKGSVFRVELPWARSSAWRAQAPENIPDYDLSGLKILAVDDDADAREILERVLKDRSADVRVAASAAEAWEMMRDYRPSVLICDISMPDEDGYSLMGRVRGDASRELGAIALTAFARPEERARSLSAGFNMHVSKPIQVNALLKAVSELKRICPDIVTGQVTGHAPQEGRTRQAGGDLPGVQQECA